MSGFRKRSTRILLDSNIWRYFVDAGAIPALGNAARKSRHTVVIAPATLYEAAYTSETSVRNALLAAMTKPWWKRLMPEAYSEAEEFKTEARRLRSDWLRAHPDLALFKRVRYDWLRAKGGLWDRILDDAKLLQKYEEDSGDRRRARDQAYQMRDEAMSWPLTWRTVPLTQTFGRPSVMCPGWNGTAVEAWRFDAHSTFEQALRTPGHPTIDWIGGEFDTRLLLSQRESQTRFWLHDVKLQNMPRHWLRWAFEFLQRLYRVTDGTPGDAQLGTYLLDVDLMFSADKRLVEIAERCRQDAPFAVAESRLIPGGSAAVEPVLAFISGQ